MEGRELADHLIAFGNADGGTIIVGLVGGEVEGTNRAGHRRNDQMQAAMDFSEPPVRARPTLVECRRGDGTPDRLLVIEVESGEAVHANRKDEVFLRVGDEKRRLTFAQRQELVYDKGQSSYETRVLVGSHASDVDEALLESYATAIGAGGA